MEAYIKKHFWVVNLVFVALVSYSAMRVVNYVIIDQTLSELNNLKLSKKKSNKSLTSTTKRPSWEKIISERNLFNANPPAPQEESGAGSTEEKKPEGEFPNPYEQCAESTAKATLKFTMVAEPSSESYVVIDLNNEDRIFKEGDQVEEHEIISIQWNGEGGRVVLLNQTKYECLVLGKKKKKRFSPKPKRGRSSSKRAKNKANAKKLKEGIKEVSPGRYMIDRAMLDEQLNDLDSLLRQARVIPHYKKGKPSGFKVVGIRSNSIFRHLGLKSGDVLKSVGGEELTSINKALGLFDKLKTSDNVSLDLDRKGKMNSFEYNIK